MLTQTNEEAVIIVALIRKHGLKCQLIQSNDGFRYMNMAEVRYFLKQIEKDTHTPLIADEVWDKAKRKTSAAYAGSKSLPYLECCIRLFEMTNKAKYLTDFKDFVFESSVEDFCDTAGADVVVSTIHKAKGREFDDVYMLLTQQRSINDDVMRRYYVGMTRAKKHLSVHTNSMIFNGFPADKTVIDPNQYEMPEEISLQLSHKDVNLGFFKTIKKEILSLRLGDELSYDNNLFLNPKTSHAVAQLSQKMRSELQQWEDQGYHVSEASIRFIVAWRPKDAPKGEKEHAIILTDLTMRRA